MQNLGVNYWETYYPVVNYVSFKDMLTLIILGDTHTKSIDFILAYTQYYVKSESFMEIPIVFVV